MSQEPCVQCILPEVLDGYEVTNVHTCSNFNKVS